MYVCVCLCSQYKPDNIFMIKPLSEKKDKPKVSLLPSLSFLSVVIHKSISNFQVFFIFINLDICKSAYNTDSIIGLPSCFAYVMTPLGAMCSRPCGG